MLSILLSILCATSIITTTHANQDRCPSTPRYSKRLRTMHYEEKMRGAPGRVTETRAYTGIGKSLANAFDGTEEDTQIPPYAAKLEATLYQIKVFGISSDLLKSIRSDFADCSSFSYTKEQLRNGLLQELEKELSEYEHEQVTHMLEILEQE